MCYEVDLDTIDQHINTCRDLDVSRPSSELIILNEEILKKILIHPMSNY